MPTIDFDLKCLNCGESLKGLAFDETCPDCGNGVDQTLFLPIIASETLTVVGDLTCRHCEYNLRTLPISSLCPECGRAVADSLLLKDLRFLPMKRLRQVRTALIAMSIAFLSVFVPCLAIFAIPLCICVSLHQLAEESRVDGWTKLQGCLRPRQTAIPVLAAVVLVVGMIVFATEGFEPYIGAIAFAVVGLCVFGVACIGSYLQDLFAQAHQSAVVAEISVFILMFVTSFVLGSILVVLSLFESDTGVPPFEPLAEVLVFLGMILAAGTYLLGGIVSFRCGRRVSRAIKQHPDVAG